MDRALVLMAHVASQLIGRWYPPPLSGLADSDTLDTEGWGARDWLALVESLRMRLRALGLEWSPWLATYDRLFADGGVALARAVVRHMAEVRQAGGAVVCWDDPGYPARLREIPDPPLALAVLGDPAVLGAAHSVSVIGSRKASGLALRESYELGAALAAAGCTVVSGGAFGCDIAAHLGSLASGRSPLPAVVVLAGGLASLYPRAHMGVFERLLGRGGALISERLWWAPSRRHDFPARNRIIAGLSPLTAVMQAAQRSGALITARQALDQGREVAILLHPPGDVRASGSEILLRAGGYGFYSHAALLERLKL